MMLCLAVLFATLIAASGLKNPRVTNPKTFYASMKSNDGFPASNQPKISSFIGIRGGSLGAIAGDGSSGPPIGDPPLPPPDIHIPSENYFNNMPKNSDKETGLQGYFKRGVERYDYNLRTYPILTKVISAAIVAALGDILTQAFKCYKKNLPFDVDLTRLGVFMLVSCMLTPAVHVWFNYLNTLSQKLPQNIPKFRKTVILTMVDQTVGALTFTSAFYYAFELVRHYLILLLALYNRIPCCCAIRPLVSYAPMVQRLFSTLLMLVLNQ
jgi:hypothetical protein